MTPHKIGSVRFTNQSPTAAGGAESGSISAGSTIMNWVRGLLHSQYAGLVRTGVRIKVGARADLRVRWAKKVERGFVVGQSVAMIPATAVRLESGMFRRSKQRWNRWIGRIVLIQQVEAGTLYTVKVRGEEWTLKSLGPVVGAHQPSKAWDIVNVVVDPQMVELSVAAPCLVVRPRSI